MTEFPLAPRAPVAVGSGVGLGRRHPVDRVDRVDRRGRLDGRDRRDRLGRRWLPSAWVVAASAAGSRVGIAGVMVHSVMVVGMIMLLVAPMASRAGLCLFVAVACLGTSLVIAPAARSQAWARDAIIDLWAMALLTLSMVAAHPSVVGSTGPVALGAAFEHHPDGRDSCSLVDLATTPGVVVGAWTVLRLLPLLTSRRRHARRASAAILTLTLAADPTSTTRHAPCTNPRPDPSPPVRVDAAFGPTRTSAALGSRPAPALSIHRRHWLIAVAGSALQLLVMLAMH
jgi:hypothetical protein